MNFEYVRQVVLDTETTGINRSGVHYIGHRIIEIGAVEIINRRLTGKNFHVYINPNRKIDPEAFNIHGISNKFLSDKPIFSAISCKFINFIRGSELIIHNAQFDLGFINYELNMLNGVEKNIDSLCSIVDTLLLARKKFPGRRNSLDALCERYAVNKSNRILHNAMVDAKILATIFLLMTGGQTTMRFTMEDKLNCFKKNSTVDYQDRNKICSNDLRIIFAASEEIKQHKNMLNIIKEKYGYCMWSLCVIFVINYILV
ncbi:DNA polymerase III subunit epsilon [Blochmannia endosymbiont of Camponotus (Colobopsis) obliquus]|uniref:DNA polymerase III subunit epsilon n=1 Tax=Blochmannia endosymbiont of Camponotus (Colobopsis) obliquus TaxID=1505597 RepID=UPI00061A7BAC|nr:DNA polymerase III subunit epsilon [Blochmannia endosymbiont of Camponotus (Colobopsis) obliquus]AKC60395.1 DNA polymerase III subunit epsilon [Blochmannia endosymbiont of Camponotus (Colobopsis) obliquus]